MIIRTRNEIRYRFSKYTTRMLGLVIIVFGATLLMAWIRLFVTLFRYAWWLS